MQNFVEEAARASMQSLQQRQRGCRRRATGCLLAAVLLLAAACGLLFLAVDAVRGAEPDAPDGLAVYLLVDNSDSMFPAPGAPASDPSLLRLEAVRLVLTYLALDQATTAVSHAAQVLYFGGDVEIVLAAAPLPSPGQMESLLAALPEPARMGWTDPAAALELVQQRLGQVPGRPVVILLTDGRPEWDGPTGDAQRLGYEARLTAVIRELADAGAPLYVIVLDRDDATDADDWRPLWEAAATGSGGRLVVATAAGDLAPAYHSLIADLAGYDSASVPSPGPDGADIPVAVPDGLAQLTLLLSADASASGVGLFQPDGQPVRADGRHVRQATSGGSAIWTITAPQPGRWLVRPEGGEAVAVWRDYRFAMPSIPTRAVQPAPTVGLTPTPVASLSTGSAATTQSAATTNSTATPPQAPASQLPAAPTSKAPQPATVFKPEATGPVAYSWWGGGFLAFAIAAAGIWWRRRRQWPLVTGTLRSLAGPGFAGGRTVCDLENLARRRVTVGQAPADVILTTAGEQIVIEPGPGVVAETEMWLSGPESVQLNGQPLATRQRLEDAAVIEIGVHKLRYENLRWRRALRAANVRTHPIRSNT